MHNNLILLQFGSCEKRGGREAFVVAKAISLPHTPSLRPRVDHFGCVTLFNYK